MYISIVPLHALELEAADDVAIFTRYHVLEWLSKESMTVDEIIGRASRDSPGVSVFTWNSIVIPILERLLKDGLIDYADYNMIEGVKYPVNRSHGGPSYTATKKGLQLHDDMSIIHSTVGYTIGIILRACKVTIFAIYNIFDIVKIILSEIEHKSEKSVPALESNTALPPDDLPKLEDKN